MIQQYSTLQEEIQSACLPNGLRVYYIPKTEFQKTFAMLGTNFGSVDCCFTLDGTQHKVTPGVAHFLEHKMFEEADGNALQKFSAYGAQPNAFTSHTMTAYHFTSTEQFYESLEILLRFVTTPYFTEENVAKEKGIIEQEISMLDDTPSWQAYVGVLQGLYADHPVRISIAGSKESIAPIDPALLQLCHRAFYSPSNLALVVCGTCDFDRVCDLAQRITPKESARIASRAYGKEIPEAARAVQVRQMAVSRPTYMLGFKDTVPEQPYSRQIVGELAVRCVCCESAPLYERLYQQQLIDQSFGVDYFTFPEGACAFYDGESRDPQAVRDAILEEIRSIAQHGVDPALFERARRQLLGLKLRSADDPSSICRMQAEACFDGASCFDFYEILTKVTPEQVEERIREWAKPNRASLMVVEPVDGEAGDE
ncbi:MAG: pitrilysin family protein [Eubacteriales bacterium]|nr:pitrilysin family protein [Eubacteriales bacterium]